MGDRTYVEVYMSKADVEKLTDLDMGYGSKFADLWNDIEEEPHTNTVKLSAYEANCAYYDELHEIAKAGVTFHGNHGEGGNYPAGQFFGHGGKYHQIPTNGEDFTIAVDDNGRISEQELTNVRAFLQAQSFALHGIDKQLPPTPQEVCRVIISRGESGPIPDGLYEMACLALGLPSKD